MILIEIDEKIGTYTQKKPIIQLFDPYLSLKWSWISHKQKNTLPQGQYWYFYTYEIRTSVIAAKKHWI